MIQEAEVVLDGVRLRKMWSDQYVKIQCNEDMNIYNVVYTTLSSMSTFSETSIPIEDYKIPASSVVGLSSYIKEQNEPLALSVEGNAASIESNALCIQNIVEKGIPYDEGDLSAKVIKILDRLDGDEDGEIVIDPGGSED